MEASAVSVRALETPDVTVVIPTRDRLHYLKDAVASVLAQVDVSVRCVVVDDGSTDGTSDWLRDLEDPRVRTISVSRSSERSTARNAGLAASRSGLVLFLDDDDVLARGALSTLAECLWRHPGSVVAIGRQVQFTDDGRHWLEKHPVPRRPADLRRCAMYGPVLPPGQCLLVTDVVRRVGGWDPRYQGPEDQDLLLRIAEAGRGCFVPHVTYLKRVHPGNLGVGDDSVPADRMRAEHVARLGSSHEGQVAARRYEARRWLHASYDSHGRGQAFRGLLMAVRSLLRDPGLIFDPVTRGGTTRYLVHCLVRSVPGTYRVARALGLTSSSGDAA